METKNAVSGAAVVKNSEIPFAEWRKRATPAEREEVEFSILTGTVPQNVEFVFRNHRAYVKVEEVPT